MKKSFIWGCCCLFSLCLKAQERPDSFKIVIQLVERSINQKIFLTYNEGGKRILDSALLKDGKCTFSGILHTPLIGQLFIKSAARALNNTVGYFDRDYQVFFIDPGLTLVKGIDSISTAVIKGGKSQTDFIVYNSMMKPFEEKLGPLLVMSRRAFRNGDKEKFGVMLKDYAGLSERIMAANADFILSHSDSYVSLYQIYDLIRNSDAPVSDVESAFNSLSVGLKNSNVGVRIKDYILAGKKIQVGNSAIPFTLNDQDGNPVTLSDYKGKYVLINFWASWSKRCRVRNSEIAEVHREFKDRDFVIISVSVDTVKNSWLTAVKEDNLTWIQLNEPNNGKESVASLYNIYSIPQNILIDREGIIVAKDLESEEMLKKLRLLINT